MRQKLSSRLKLRQIEIVIAVAEQGSFLAASHQLELSQPAVSKAVQEIEAILGQPIFDRVPRGVLINPFGKAVVERGRAMLSLVERLGDDVVLIEQGLAGTLVIGALPTAASSVLPAALGRLRATNPDLNIRIVQGRTVELMPQLESGKLDIIVGRLYEAETSQDVQRETIYHEPISMIVRADHPLLKHGKVDVETLARYGLVLPSLEQRLGQEVDSVLAYSNLLPSTPPLRSTSLSFIRELILSSDFVTVLPRLMLAGDLTRGAVHLLPVALVSVSRPAGIVSLRHRRRPASVAALITALREHLRELQKTGLLD
ncbi:LysR substrate-binding domain-containing protein [Ancylobacter defluvii]|uniref:Transcriptional regulator n=1 Tax=Ancylobacter defluvii TaxID=1282440 RepID=A0A9W6JYR9_9HYPH|nr:LysR substrate-binding domain-containing protein [Ancylobacter defluvii]MBS7586356.1 LysR family transcriptional regulator [Ancylobacter defluvii]GLK85637.1 transcriptional regulator [Ancylobacter defluvii]